MKDLFSDPSFWSLHKSAVIEAGSEHSFLKTSYNVFSTSYKWGKPNWSGNNLRTFPYDFFWFEFMLNLTSKSLYVFRPGFYDYCDDFITHKSSTFVGLRYVFKHSVKCIVDIDQSTENALEFLNHSKNNIDSYVNNFIKFIELLDKEACLDKLQSKNMIQTVITTSYGLAEFSMDSSKLSNIFLSMLRQTIR